MCLREMTKGNEYINEPVRNTNLQNFTNDCRFSHQNCEIVDFTGLGRQLGLFTNERRKTNIRDSFTNYCIVARENNEHAT